MNDYWDDEWQPTGRCSGKCCRLITLSLPAEEIAEIAALNAQNARVRRNLLLLRDPPPMPWFRWGNPDATFVVENFVFVRNSYVDAISGYRYTSPMPQYRCKAWSGYDCTRYNERPHLCREHGTPHHPCPVEGCGLKWRYRDDRARWADDGGSPHELDTRLNPNPFLTVGFPSGDEP